MGPHWIPHDGPNPFAAEAAAGPLGVPAPEQDRPDTIAAFDDVAWGETTEDGYRERWKRLTPASIKAGLNFGDLEAGQLPCPPHWHAMEEECFVILGGEGEALIGDDWHPVHRGHVLVCPPGGPAHTLRGPLTYLGYGTRVPGDYAFFPRSRKLSFRNGVVLKVGEVDYWEGE
jgi:hypothetical protein